MLVETTRFGTLEVKEEDIFHFPEGVLGFPHLKRFFWREVEGNPVFRWLQAVDDGQVAFLLVDPFMFIPGYELKLEKSIQETLDIAKKEEILVYTTVTIPEEGVAQATTNLVGPLIFNLNNKRGCQVVLEGVEYGVKQRLFGVSSHATTDVEGK